MDEAISGEWAIPADRGAIPFADWQDEIWQI